MPTVRELMTGLRSLGARAPFLRERPALVAAALVAIVGLAGWIIAASVGGNGGRAAVPEAQTAAPQMSDEVWLEVAETLAGIAARQIELEASMTRIEARLEALGAMASPVTAADPSVSTLSAGDGSAGRTVGAASDPGARGERERLMMAGLSGQGADAVIRRLEGVEMARLRLRDQAAREGWLDTDRYRSELDALPSVSQVLRQELGDVDYDDYLYAASQANRVMVASVMQDSPARLAGVEPGDVIFSLAGQRVFEADDLLEVASTGSAGETVSLQVIRDTEVVELHMPLGPLGVQTLPYLGEPGPG